jgi:hypothetical protein
MKKHRLIEKEVFIRSSQTLIIAFAELGARIYVDSILRRGLGEVHALSQDARRSVAAVGAPTIASMAKEAFGVLTSHLDESYVTLSYSWMETYLTVVEEALYLNDPKSLGDNIQVKLGKILETDSIAELVHDAAKRRVRDKSAWGLKSRIADLRELYGLHLPYTDDDLEEIARTRNLLVHDKKVGDFKVQKGKVTYAHRQKYEERPASKNYVHRVVNLSLDLFLETSKLLRVDRRNQGFRDLERLCENFRHVFENKSEQGEAEKGGRANTSRRLRAKA